MQPLLNSAQMHLADAYTIKKRAISSADLMEVAATAFTSIFTQEYPDRNARIAVYCGRGNNGGDGLAIARLLVQLGYTFVNVLVAGFGGKASPDFSINLQKLHAAGIGSFELTDSSQEVEQGADIIIDALLGSGLNRPLSGAMALLADRLNASKAHIVSVDVPTGLYSEGHEDANAKAVRSHLVITFHQPRLSFLLPECAPFVRKFIVADIGLDVPYLNASETPYRLLQDTDIGERLRPRAAFSHKGTYGHALVLAGSAKSMGAAILSSAACVYTGAGLTTACIPASGLSALNARLPEAMALLREGSQLPGPLEWHQYNSIAVGPGLGTEEAAHLLLKEVLNKYSRPMVLDADALTILSQHNELMAAIPKGSVLTPHMKEFDRLFGQHTSWWERLKTGRVQAGRLHCYILLKNRYSILFCPDGLCIFNPTGSPAMATGGMGDVLSGMLASLLAQAYSPEDAALLAMYLHGLCGQQDMHYVLPAGELIKKIPAVMSRYIY